jgi:hypothetical protein
MIAVFASAADAEPERAFAGHDDVAVIRPADLSRSAWRWESARERVSLPMPDGEVLDATDLSGVLTRMPRVRAAELPYVHHDDREYVAAEMTAFVAALLAALEVPVINRGDGASLCGPHWTGQHWRRRAARLGHPVCTCANPEPTEMTVIGHECVLLAGTAVTESAPAWALALARVTGVDLLGVTICAAEEALIATNVRPCLTPTVTASVLALMRRT